MKRVTMFILISFSLHAEGVTELSVIEKNQILENSQINEATVRQGEINLIGDSTILDVQVGDAQSQNLISASTIDHSDLQQGGVDVNGSSLLHTKILVNNQLLESHIQNSSHIKQGTVKITDSGEIKESSFNLSNTINGATIDSTTLSQSEIMVEHSTVNGLTFTGVHTIANENESISITNSDVTQGKLSVIGSSNLTNSTIDMHSNIDDTTITDSSIDLCSVYLSNGADVDGADIHGECSMEESTITGTNFTQGSIVVY